MPRIIRMALAANNIAQMVTFYNLVLDAGLAAIPNMPEGFHSGQLAGIPLVIAPNAILDIQAEQSRHQFDLEVDDIEATMQTALSAGGRLLSAVEDQGGGVKIGSVYDPDGNSIVFVQR